MVKINHVFSYAIIGILIMVFGIYTSTMNYASAVTTSNVTFPAGTTTIDVTYRKDTANPDTTAYILGTNGGIVYVWEKSGSSNNIIFNVTLTGSTAGRAIEFNPDMLFIYVATNDKFYKISTSLGISVQLASGIATNTRKLIYDDFSETLYFCTNDSYGTVNQVTLTPTTFYTDPQTNAVLDCAFDTESGFAYLTGVDIGSGFNADIIKIDLDTHTQVDSNAVPNFLFGVCVDTMGDFVWASESSAAKVYKYDMATLTQQAVVTVGTTPRFCTINTDDTGRRLYQVNESTDNVSILDIDANQVLTTVSVCNQGTTTPKPDTKRLFNTTNTFITCPETVNTIVIDDTVSEFFPPEPPIGGIDCSLPENENILTCRLADVPPLTGTSTLLNQSGTNIVCMIGLLPCTQDEDGNFTPDNPDITTNGIGFFYLAIALGIFVSMLYLGSDGRLSEIPTFVWFIGSLAIVGAMTQLGFVDPTILIVAVIVVSALATAKVKGVLGDSGLFRGE